MRCGDFRVCQVVPKPWFLNRTAEMQEWAEPIYRFHPFEIIDKLARIFKYALMTVSYTHLDVYKRQRQDLGLTDSCTILEETLKASAPLIREEGELEELRRRLEEEKDLDRLEKLGAEYHRRLEAFEAVSYTHLL